MANPKQDNIFDEIADAVGSEPTERSQSADAPAQATAEAGPDAGTPDADISPIIEALTVERDELKDRLLRALAEAENARKRGDRDRREAEQYGGTRLARDMLPVYDNLRRALDAGAGLGEGVSETEKAVLDGVELTLRELLNIFTRHGITLIAPEKGEVFDPQVHQAMFEAPVPDVPKGCIIQVMTEGFLLHDRLLRPAQVGVSARSA